MGMYLSKCLLAYYICLEGMDEEKLKLFGKKMGRNMLLIHKLEVETDLDGFIYKIVYEYLIKLYETKRTIDKQVTKRNKTVVKYFITEKQPFFSNKIVMREDETFCLETVIAGLIEYLLDARGFSCKVTAHNKEGVIYEIEIK